MKLYTERLFLREMNIFDYDSLFKILADSDIMCHYPYTFDEKRVRNWIDKNIRRCEVYGFGLFAVILRETEEMIGDCGLTIQNIDGEFLPEIGYHIRKDCQRKGYAKESAAAVIKYAFDNTTFGILYSYMKSTNIPSRKTAEAVGMKLAKEYTDSENGLTYVYAITRKEWENLAE